MKLSEIAKIVRGKTYGRKDFLVRSLQPPETAGREDLTFLFEPGITTRAGAVIAKIPLPGRSGVVVKTPKMAMYRLLKKFSSTRTQPAVSDLALIEETAVIGRSSRIEPFAVIRRGTRIGHHAVVGAHCYIDADVRIGGYFSIGPNSVILGDVTIGDFVEIGPNCVVGKSGFGYVKLKRYERLPHVGGLRIRDHVEIGGNVAIDRGTIGDTVIGAGTKIDNLVHIGHNVRLGRDCLVMGQVGIAGSTVCGDNVVLCGQVGLADHLRVGDRAVIFAKSGVFKSVPADAAWSGIPAREHQMVLKALARIYKCEPE
jgi:UDP-3-O-[3-hydroxymyristoyl] glucosamine N-acyltransferase